jgi:hypothetical protein
MELVSTTGTSRRALLRADVALRCVALAGLLGGLVFGAGPAKGPLRVHPENPRYFTADGTQAVLLTGSHTWANVVDMGPGDVPPKFDFDKFLGWVDGYGHNFVRLWTWDLVNWDTRGNHPSHSTGTRVTVAPHAWARTGPGNALDGKPKFNLEQYDPEYFRRLRDRAEQAGRRGIYVSIMLFEGWGLQFSPDAWEAHPFHPGNNINGVDGDANGDGKGIDVHTLRNPRVVELHQAYVRKVVDAVNDLDNVLFEIGNEMHAVTTDWQYAMIEFVHAYEKTKPKQHPVGMTFQYRAGSNQILLDSPADWISPRQEPDERENPRPAAEGKVILLDTDHIWGIGGTSRWVWKSLLQGMNPLFMDPYDGSILGERFDPRWEPIRQQLGYAARYAAKVNLAAMKPAGKLSSTGYCLADPGREYLIFATEGADIVVDLSGVSGEFTVEWFSPRDDKIQAAGKISGGEHKRLFAPLAGDVVLYLKRQ